MTGVQTCALPILAGKGSVRKRNNATGRRTEGNRWGLEEHLTGIVLLESVVLEDVHSGWKSRKNIAGWTAGEEAAVAADGKRIGGARRARGFSGPALPRGGSPRRGAPFPWSARRGDDHESDGDGGFRGVALSGLRFRDDSEMQRNREGNRGRKTTLAGTAQGISGPDLRRGRRG